MPRPAKVYWSARDRCWRSDVGPRGPTGRRTPIYFRDLPANDRRGAERALDAYLAERHRKERESAESMANPRLVRLAKVYLEHVAALIGEGERAGRTLKTHKERLRRLTKLPDSHGVPLGDRPVLSLTDTDGVRALALLKSQGCGPRRRAGILAAANACLNWAAKAVPGREPRQILPVNPFAGVPKPRLPKSDKRLVTRGEMALFLRSAWRRVNTFKAVAGVRCSGCHRSGKRHRGPCRRSHNPTAYYDRSTLLLIRCSYHTGARPGELCAATWADWQPRAAKGRHGQWWGTITTEGKMFSRTGEKRIIPIRPALVRAIERSRSAPTAHPERIFPRRPARGGGAWNSVDLARKVRVWREAANLPDHILMYRMRTTWYTEAVEGGLTADQAGAVGGTSAKVIESTYFQRRAAAIVEAADQVERSRRGRD